MTAPESALLQADQDLLSSAVGKCQMGEQCKQRIRWAANVGEVRSVVLIRVYLFQSESF